MVPADFPRQQAVAQLVAFLRLVAESATVNDLTIAIEPLNRKDLNILNSVAEAVELATLVDRRPVHVLADFYHMDEEQEPLDRISRHGQWLAHIHVADSGRLAPGTGQYPYAAFAAELQRAGYQGRISVECRWQGIYTQAAPAVSFLRQVFG